MTDHSTSILWLNPVHTDAYDAEMARNLNAAAVAGTTVDVLSFPPPGPTHLEYAANGMVTAPLILNAVRWASDNLYDGVCIGCFYDPGLRAAREIAERTVVTAPAEACLHTARTLGSQIAILVANRTCLADVRDAAYRTGLGDSVVAYPTLDMRVHEFQQDSQDSADRVLERARGAVEERGADVLVLGCTLEYGLGEHVQRELGVPVLDATSTPLAYSEHLVSLRNRFGLTPSLLDYQQVPADELEQLGPVTRPGPLTHHDGRRKDVE